MKHIAIVKMCMATKLCFANSQSPWPQPSSEPSRLKDASSLGVGAKEHDMQ